VQDVLIELNRETGAALVVATHNERFAMALGRCLRLEHGRLTEVQSDTPWTAGGVEGHRA
jgi:predicted ABC-type transport system involved in lysophospholipase L1 biosynthesis ATPase subunit